MRYGDLPAAARAQIDAKLGRKRRKRDTTALTGGPCAYTCHACGHPSPSWPKAEKHAIEEGHVRQDMVL